MLDACKHVCAYVCMFSAWKQTTLLPEAGGALFSGPHIPNHPTYTHN